MQGVHATSNALSLSPSLSVQACACVRVFVITFSIIFWIIISPGCPPKFVLQAFLIFLHIVKLAFFSYLFAKLFGNIQ